MTTLYLHRYHIIVAAADKPAANAVAASVTDNPADLLTFGVALSPDGNEPASHFGCSTAATDAIKDALVEALGAGLVPSVMFWHCSAADDTLIGTNMLDSLLFTGEPWSWERSLETVGLVVVQEPAL